MKTYFAIDLKSFYASVECTSRRLDPFCANLVVADQSRTDKTICLAVSPALKSFGVPGRPRLYEVIQKVRELNDIRENKFKKNFIGSSWDINFLKEREDFEIDFIIAPPQMALYMEVSRDIYEIYLNWVSSEDIFAYSIDEVFIDATDYLKLYNLTPEELLGNMINDVFNNTGITATSGIGTNLYLCKVAMDITAKKMPPNENGVRISYLNEELYRKKLWDHKPITDFWRVGKGYKKRLEKIGLYTMGDIAKCSLGGENDFHNEDLLFKTFGINAELLIDHAWGCEYVDIKDIKNYQPKTHSLQEGQVLKEPYTFDKAKVVAMEMADSLALNLVKDNLSTNQIVLNVGYDVINLKDPEISKAYVGETKKDAYGREVPKSQRGTYNFDKYTSSSIELMKAVSKIFDDSVDKRLYIRRIYIAALNLRDIDYKDEQLNFFSAIDDETEEKELKVQRAILEIKDKYGKNAILRGLNLEEGATQRERNEEIGGHKA